MCRIVLAAGPLNLSDPASKASRMTVPQPSVPIETRWSIFIHVAATPVPAAPTSSGKKSSLRFVKSCIWLGERDLRENLAKTDFWGPAAS